MIVDSSRNYQADRKPMKADAILMHRSKNIIAVRAQTGDNTIIQVLFSLTLLTLYLRSLT